MDMDVNFPFYPHKEPIAWYLKDLGMRISIFIVSVLLFICYEGETLLKTVLFLFCGFMLKDVFDYVLFYDHAHGYLDILVFMSAVIFYIVKK